MVKLYAKTIAEVVAQTNATVIVFHKHIQANP
jgi:hypothetical protein